MVPEVSLCFNLTFLEMNSDSGILFHLKPVSQVMQMHSSEFDSISLFSLASITSFSVTTWLSGSSQLMNVIG